MPAAPAGRSNQLAPDGLNSTSGCRRRVASSPTSQAETGETSNDPTSGGVPNGGQGRPAHRLSLEPPRCRAGVEQDHLDQKKGPSPDSASGMSSRTGSVRSTPGGMMTRALHAAIWIRDLAYRRRQLGDRLAAAGDHDLVVAPRLQLLEQGQALRFEFGDVDLQDRLAHRSAPIWSFHMTISAVAWRRQGGHGRSTLMHWGFDR